MKKYEITWDTIETIVALDSDTNEVAIKKIIVDKARLVSGMNAQYGNNGWKLVSVVEGAGKTTLYFQRKIEE